MTKTIDEKIDEVLGVTSMIPTSVFKPVPSARVKPITNGEDEDTDYTYTRENLYNMIERGTDAVEELLEIAKQSEHPRAFEVVGQLIRTVSDSNKELMGLHITKKDLKADTSGPKNVTNAVFVGSTAELQKLMKGKLDNGD